MAQTYEVGLRYTGGDAASRALRDADAIDSAMNKLERRRGGAALFKGADWSKTAQMATRAAEKERTAQLRMEAEAMRSAKRLEDEKRNAAFRRLQAQQREEERFTRYRINLLRKENAERQRMEEKHRAGISRAGDKTRGLAKGAATMAGTAAVVGGGYVFKEAFDTAKQIEQAKMRLTALLGSQERATAEIKDLVRAGAKTKFDWQDLVDASSSLAASFTDDKERRYVLGSLSDMVSVAGGGKQQLDQVVLAINQVVGKGKLEAEELNQLIEPLKGVVSRKEFYLEVAKLMNVSGKDEQAIIDKMQKMQKAGKIGSTVAVQAVTTVGRRKAGSEKAGDYAVQAGASIEGQISNIKTGMATLFALSDMEQWTAFNALRGLLDDVGKFFDADSEAGKNLMDSIRRGMVAVIPQIEYVRKQFHDFVSDPGAIDRLVQGVIGFGQALYFVGMVVAETVVGVLQLIGAIKQVAATAAEMGDAIAQGLANGVTRAKDAVVGAVKGTAQSVLDTAASVLDIHSPSRKMMELGQYTGEGFALGIDQSSRSVTDASMSLTDAIATGGVRGGGSSGGGISIVNNITVPIQTGSDTAQIAREVGPLLGAQIEMQLDRYLGRLVAQGA